MIFGVTWGLAAELAEVTNIIERNRGLPKPFVFGIHRSGTGEVEHRPQQHRGMTVGEHEPIAVRPNWILRIETHDAVPQRVYERRQRHWGARMPGFRLLDRVMRFDPQDPIWPNRDRKSTRLNSSHLGNSYA